MNDYFVAGRIEIRLHCNIEAASDKEAVRMVKEEFEAWLADLNWILDDSAIDFSGLYAFRAEEE
jgi:hypothetical protein